VRAPLKPPQVRLQPQHHTLQQQSRDRVGGLSECSSLRLTQSQQKRMSLPINDSYRISQASRRSSDQLQMKLRRRRLGPTHVLEPSNHSIVPGLRQLIYPTIPAVRLAEAQ
jgi:hypothetical protein